MSAPSRPVSIREFARLDGCSDKLVRRAITEGKLRLSDDNKLDAALAGSGWRRTNRRAAEAADSAADISKVSAPSRKSPHSAEKTRAALAEGDLDPSELEDEDFIAAVLSGRFVSTGEAERIKENGLAAKNLLAARREAGDVIDLEVAEAVLFEQARAFRDAWQNWPSRVAPLIAAKLGISVEPVLEALTEHVHDQLQDLGEPEGDFSEAHEG